MLIKHLSVTSQALKYRGYANDRDIWAAKCPVLQGTKKGEQGEHCSSLHCLHTQVVPF